ncbi:hypothetical protein PI126_g18050 [Phytophthora idaei]|nr:hypothetical protein PI126_g18050 [Phytophthora idaei]
MATQVHVFTSGMNAGYQRFYFTRKTPSTLGEAFAVALREDYSVTASQAFDVSRVRAPEPEPMEIYAIQQFDGRRGATPSTPRPRSSARGGGRHDRERRRRCWSSKKRRQPVGVGRPTGRGRSAGSLVAEPPPSPPVLRAHLFTTTSGSDSRLIVLSLHVDGSTRPVRALLDSGETNNFVRAESLSVLPADTRVRKGARHMIMKYADSAQSSSRTSSTASRDRTTFW